MERRQIKYNTIIMNEILYYMKQNRKGEHDMMATKIDMSKSIYKPS